MSYSILSFIRPSSWSWLCGSFVRIRIYYFSLPFLVCILHLTYFLLFNSLINHGGGKHANVKLQWSKSQAHETGQLTKRASLEESISTASQNTSTNNRSLDLMLELVVIQPIWTGDEILLDYGIHWIAVVTKKSGVAVAAPVQPKASSVVSPKPAPVTQIVMDTKAAPHLPELSSDLSVEACSEEDFKTIAQAAVSNSILNAGSNHSDS
jgi:hypothetical protein